MSHARASFPLPLIGMSGTRNTLKQNVCAAFTDQVSLWLLCMAVVVYITGLLLISLNYQHFNISIFIIKHLHEVWGKHL